MPLTLVVVCVVSTIQVFYTHLFIYLLVYSFNQSFIDSFFCSLIYVIQGSMTRIQTVFAQTRQ